MYMTILAAWSAVLSRLSGQDDIVIGTPTANRNHHQIESLIGFFVNTLALRIDLSGDPSIRQLVERVRRCTIGAQAHQDLPFEQVVDIVQPPRDLSHTPLFQVMFVWENSEDDALHLPGLQVDSYEADYDAIKFDIELHLYETGDEIVGDMSYSMALYDHTTMKRHVGYLQAMLSAMTNEVDRVVTNVDLLATAEGELLLKTWNATQQDYPSDLCIHHLFEQQVERTPEATAVVFMGQSLSYGELNKRANRLAHHLIRLGVKPDTRVAICVDRSIAMVIGVLAILKAGGAYVPLDPAYASDRLCDILVDATPNVAIVDAPGRQSLGDEALSCITVMDLATVSSEGQDSEGYANPRIADLTSDHLAYVIYTSGSTGKPKGVMVEHQGIVNAVLTRPVVFGTSASTRVLQFFSFAFDGCALEIFMTTCLGGSLHILPDSTRTDPGQLWSYLEAHSITQATLPPAILQSCKDLEPL
ncbi:hypothetical protein BGX31_003184, partial [Mortierella sp. GBA43]